MSPGPSFVLVANTTLSLSRNHGIAASIGMGAGGVILSLLALMGLHTILTNAPTAYLLLKLMGGIYLAYLAIRIWQGSRRDLTIETNTLKQSRSLKNTFFISLVTQLSNPKAAVIYSGIFAALLPEKIPHSLYFILPPLVFVVEAGWYLVVTMVLSTPSSRAAYLSSKIVYDRIAAGIMGILSFRLLSSVSSD